MKKKFETPEQWEKRMGRKMNPYQAVYTRRGKNDCWHAEMYFEAMSEDAYCREFGTPEIIVANCDYSPRLITGVSFGIDELNKEGRMAKKGSLMAVHESLERIREKDIGEMNLFELSIRSLMPGDIFHEIRRRFVVIRDCLINNDTDTAQKTIDSFLKWPNG